MMPTPLPNPTQLPVASPECATCTLGIASQPRACPFREVRLAAGTRLIEQGQQASHAWYLRQGAVLLTSVGAGGDETFCAVRGPGAMLGLELLRGDRSTVDVWTLSETVLCRLDGERFDGWLGPREGPIGAMLELVLREAAARHEERIALSGSAVKRLARFLLVHRRRGGDEAVLGLQHQIIARMLGMRPETLSRAIRQLRDVGAVEPPPGHRIRDDQALERAAGED